MTKLDDKIVKILVEAMEKALEDSNATEQDHREGPPYDYYQLEQQLNQASKKITELEIQCKEASEYTAKVAREKDHYIEHYQELSNDRLSQNQQLTNEIMQLKATAVNSNKTINTLEQMVRNQAKTIGDYQKEERKQTSKVSTTDKLAIATLKDITSKLNTATEYTTRLETTVNELCDSETELMEENVELRNKCSNQSEAISTLKQRLHTKDSSVEELKGQITGLLHENQTMLSTINAVKQYQRLYKLSL